MADTLLPDTVRTPTLMLIERPLVSESVDLVVFGRHLMGDCGVMVGERIE